MILKRTRLNYYLNERNKNMCRRKKDPEKKGFFGEFKEFITRGNIIDLAVGIIIGGAFTAIVTALTSGIFQPLINWALGNIIGDGSLESARTILGTPAFDDMGQIDWAKTNYIDWGTFISAIINFLLVALILFCIIKLINRAHKAGLEAKAKLEAEAKVKAEEKAKEEEKAEDKKDSKIKK